MNVCSCIAANGIPYWGYIFVRKACASAHDYKVKVVIFNALWSSVEARPPLYP